MNQRLAKEIAKEIVREIVLDTETTGLNPFDGHRVIEIGAVEMINKVVTGREFHVYINPKREVPNEAYRIHGLSTKFLADKPLFAEIVDDFLAFIEDGILVIHNAQFDIKFLNHELSLLKKMPLDIDKAVDTLMLARRKFPGAKVNLDALCRRFKIDNTARQYHGALLDSHLLAQVYVELTGGRQATFTMQNKGEELASKRELKQAIGNKIIIRPTEDEQKKHAEFISSFMKI